MLGNFNFFTLIRHPFFGRILKSLIPAKRIIMSTELNSESIAPVAPHVSAPVVVADAPAVTSEKPKKEKKPVAPKEPARPVDDVTRLNIIVGKLKRVWEHPEADKLWCEEVDCGDDEPRLIASGLRGDYKTAQDMEGKMVLVLANLKPRAMRGFVSNGMLLCATNEEKAELIEPPSGAIPGERVTISDLVGEADAVLNAKKNPWEAVSPFFRTAKDEPIAMFKDMQLMTSAGPCRAATMTDSQIS